MKIIKGDKIKVLIGKDKSREGEVVRVFPKTQRVVVQGINLFKKHVKATRNQKGGIVEKEKPLQISKVMLICPNCQKATRVGYQIDKSGDKSRLCRRCHTIINAPSASK